MSSNTESTVKQQIGKTRSSCCSCKLFLTILGILAALAFVANTFLSTVLYIPAFNFNVNLRANGTQLQELMHATTAITNGTTQHQQSLSTASAYVTKAGRNCTEEFKKRHFMTISYSGRTGNLLFQLASLLAIADMTCYTPVCKAPVPLIDSIFDLHHIERRNLKPFQFQYLPERGYAIYDGNFTSNVREDRNWTLAGYKQSFRYFKDYTSLVKSSFCFKGQIKQDVAKYINSGAFDKTQTIGLHVRRGDTRSHKHWRSADTVKSVLDFINRAINYIKKIKAPATISVIVVSDDIAWCRQHIKGDFFHYSPFKTAGSDLYLLTQCDHNILALQSTFSWMGVWLNETGTVIYNRKLAVNTKTFIYRDYFPGHWLAL